MRLRLLINISFFSLLASDAVYYLSTSLGIGVAATYLIIALRFTSFFCLLYISNHVKWLSKIPAWASIFFKLMIFWNVIVIATGILKVHDYWDWKFLFFSSFLSLMVPLAMLSGILFAGHDLFNLTVTRLYLWGYLGIPLTVSIDREREFFPRALMITVSTCIMLIPYIKLKWRLLILAVTATSVFLAYDFRTNILRIGCALALVGLYYIRRYVPSIALKLFVIICLVFPLIFLTLGVTGQYDIFKPSDDIEKYSIEYSNGTESNLANDTRTFLYEEVLSYMKSNNSFLFGEGATAKYKTIYFDEVSVGEVKGRYGSEVGFLNTLLYAGIVGVLLYALLLFSAVYYGLAYSNNFFCKMLAMFLAFRWVLFFIEDFVEYDMNFYFLWMAAGLCLSKDFRALSDADIRNYFSFSAKKQAVPELT